ncbi:hypothetical protein [Desulfosporosinus sp. FKA]|uniref:hypothetical protein n=1 Tax=Desulfosporosinus sp. FKA TaxID=1969834 RepID=UPI000B49BF75|nr:hypothetical protein [Desulfosporosinus sp. FKA]
MEINPLSAIQSMEKQKLKVGQPGERILVEVLQKDEENYGIIRVKGQALRAILETSAEVGDKFWVNVGDEEDGVCLLLREPYLENPQDIPVNSQEFMELTERGMPLRQDLVNLIRNFTTFNSGVPLLDNLQGLFSQEFLDIIKKSFPKWETLIENNGAEKIIDCLRKLGIDYEQRFWQMLKLDPRAREQEKEQLKNTLKYALLKEINDQTEEDHSEKSLTDLLDAITGQQLWLKTGTLNNGYVLLHLPLMNQERCIPVKIGIESARKGTKMDENHCRIAIQMETETLGLIGVDAYFSQDSLTLDILSSDPELPELVAEVLPETKAQFTKLGFLLSKVDIEDLEHNSEFKDFLLGHRRHGVDVAG